MPDETTPTAGQHGPIIDETNLADLVGEGVAVGHGGIPVAWIVIVVLVIVWALLAWTPWKGY